MALVTVADFVLRARVLLQDKTVPYRYTDADVVEGLNLAVLEARRLRPDLYFDDVALPTYSDSAQTVPVTVDQQYRVAFVYYMVGHIQLQDDETTTDARASAFLGMFRAQLTSGA